MVDVAVIRKKRQEKVVQVAVKRAILWMSLKRLLP